VARLIVLDASIVIAALAADDAHHKAATAALADASDDELVLAATTRAEILVGPARAGGNTAAARDFVDGCETVPVSSAIADGAAALKARHRALSLPDAITLVVAEMIEADTVWTFDRRWRDVQPRVVIP
jgi:predicted nucleic acid-binding protein